MGALALALLLDAGAAPPTPLRPVTDESHLLSPATEEALDARLVGVADQTGRQVLVWIGPAGDVEPEVFAVDAFDAWRPGRAGIDDGLVLFLFPDARRSRIEVGYGLEDLVPDAVASQILLDVVSPRLEVGDWDGATTAGVEAILVAIDPAATRPDRPAVPPTVEWIFAAIALVAFLVLLAVRPRLALTLLWALARGAARSRTRGPGGWKGGGGRSGGGGASGRW